jgi:hypothetical protein
MTRVLVRRTSAWRATALPALQPISGVFDCMKPERRDTKPPAPADREQTARDRDEVRAFRRDRARRIGAAQMAAPSARTWRRAGRFGSEG